MAKKSKSAGRGKSKSAGTDEKRPTEGFVAMNMDPGGDFAAARAGGGALAARAATVIYVHGINNKPTVDLLRCQWDKALFGRRMGDKTRMAYWVDRERYPTPSPATCDSPDHPAPDDGAAFGIRTAATGGDLPPSDAELIKAIAGNKEQADWLAELNTEMLKNQPDAGAVSAAGVGDFFGGAADRIFRLTRGAFLADVHDFFYKADRRKFMLDSVRDRMEAGGGPFVVIGHSQGSMVAYEFLRRLKRADCHVPLFITIGSPLGLPPVRSRFEEWTGESKLPFPPCVDRWVNVANLFDPVCSDRDLTDDIEPGRGTAKDRFKNHKVNSPNADLKQNRHSGTGYLKTDQVRAAVRDAVGIDFAQAVAMHQLAEDLVEEAEQTPGQRVPALIQLRTEPDKEGPGSIDEVRDAVVERIETLTADAGKEAVGIDVTRRFVAARLTLRELEQLRTEWSGLRIERVWRDMEKRALINRSRVTIQASAANLAYNARGEGITWAVLDTGVDANHRHFELHRNIAGVWDCTGSGVTSIPEANAADPNGHGTHVAGIIAGEWSPDMATDAPYAGMAPRTRLHCFKVLTDNGSGQDSFIIKALDKIAKLNEDAGQLVIHGVNLSLGGYFDPGVYGCGHTPLCSELRRLWRQGVVVVIAAGNEGHEFLRTASGGVRPANLDLSIGDPANLEESIAVGSVHRENPHTYGVSFFSSRGPTADGRLKPDVVAPGEKIRSARAGGQGNTAEALYVESSGTSMAAPHVAGVLAAFMSVRREFIGNPDRVKEILLAHCTDLRRDRYLQGAGMPNLVRMLAGT